jgi:hypothetical protein
MKKVIICLACLGVPTTVLAQVNVDMARITCAQYLTMSAADSATFSAWMSGWFNQKKGYIFVDLNAYARNVANVKSWCTSNPAQTVMAGLERSTAGSKTVSLGDDHENRRVRLHNIFNREHDCTGDRTGYHRHVTNHL